MKKNRILLHIVLGLASVSGIASAQNVLDLRQSITDETIVYPESFESDTRRMLEGWYMKNYTATDDRYATMPDADVSDAVVTRRLASLPTVIDMPFNSIVRSYIDRYTRDSRPQIAAILGLGIYYMPIFEQALEERGLPLELKYLPVIESALDPNAVSRHGATGLWQFMLGTAKGLGLEVSSLVDERRDPYESSAAAAGYLKELYDTYHDWSLAIAAYNCGPGAVNKAIRRAGGDPAKHDFWSIYNYLSPETRGYVPMFIAANYVMNYYPEHNISPVLATKPLVTDTLHISDRVHFNQISEVLSIPVDEIRILNPQFREDIIPGTPDSPYTLILPTQQIQAYLLSEKAIKEHDAELYARRTVAEPGAMPGDAAIAEEEMVVEDDGADDRVQLAEAPTLTEEKRTRNVVHKVAAGETLASIAKAYGVTVADLKNDNNLRRNAVRVGQQLRVTTTETVAVAAAPSGQTHQAQPAAASKPVASAEKPKAEKPKAEKVAKAETSKTGKQAKAEKKAKSKPATPTSHAIKNGESLSSIAKKYGTTVAELKAANGMKDDNLRAGNTLTIPSKKGTSAKKGKGASSEKSAGKKGGSKKSGKKKSKKR